MAKKGGSGKHYTSKGIVGVNKKLSKAVRADRSAADVALNKLKAFEQGKRVYITIDNPNPNERNKRKVRVLANTLYGDPKSRRRSGGVLSRTK